MRKLNPKEKKYFDSFHPMGSGNITRCRKNAIIIHAGNKINHELTKSVIGIMIAKFNDFKLTKHMKCLIQGIENEINSLDLPDSEGVFISEACKNSVKRRVDIVHIGLETDIEVENDHKVFKEGSLTIYI